MFPALYALLFGCPVGQGDVRVLLLIEQAYASWPTAASKAPQAWRNGPAGWRKPMQEQQTPAQRPAMAVVNPIIRLHEADNVVMARATLLPGTSVGDGVITAQRVPPGHKGAVRRIEAGEAVRKYNQIIGFATQAIAAGEHVHVHNVGMGDFVKDYAFSVDAKPTDYVPEPATFEGIVRPDGRVATRNYIGILTSVNCSAHTASLIADAFKRNPFTGYEPLTEFPNVDGVVALTHKTGCGMAAGEGLQILRRTLAGYARHPNFSHVIVLGLGCEVNQIGEMIREHGLDRIRNMDIQSMGGIGKTV